MHEKRIGPNDLKNVVLSKELADAIGAFTRTIRLGNEHDLFIASKHHELLVALYNLRQAEEKVRNHKKILGTISARKEKIKEMSDRIMSLLAGRYLTL